MDKSHGSDLHTFREEWKCEINKQHCVKNDEMIASSSSDAPDKIDKSGCTGIISNVFHHTTISEPLHLPNCNESNLQNTQFVSKKPKLVPVPLLTLDIPSYQIMQTDYGNKNKDILPGTVHLTQSDSFHGDHDLISLLIRDIDETTTVPFFDISLPKEVCLKIFSHLNVKELCHCACVSKAWSPLADDELTWYNIYKKLGFKELGKTAQEQTDWKGLVRDSILRQRSVTKNWKERICQIQTLEYEKGRALSACQMYKNVLIAGYVNGKTCLWNVESNWKDSLEPAPEVLQDPAQASVECVSVVGNVCATGFTCGIVNVWHTDISIHPIYQYRLTKPAEHLVLASPCQIPLLLTSSGSEVRVDKVQEDGQWAFSNSKSFDTQITFVHLLPHDNETAFVIAMKEDLVMYNAKTDSLSDLDKISGTKITAVTSSGEYIAVGWAPFGFGVGTEFAAKVRLYDNKTGRHLQSFLGHYGDITCLNVRCNNDGLVTGSKDKQVRVYDMRTEHPQLSLRGHSSPVTTVQMDSWKVVSGAFDGSLKVWDTRMATVLWETRTTHPVRLCQFDSSRLVTANIPLDKMPRENMWYADDLILHRRHRGSVHLYDFGGNSDAGAVVPEEMRSNYDDIAGYNYNITLVAPYDVLTTEIN